MSSVLQQLAFAKIGFRNRVQIAMPADVKHTTTQTQVNTIIKGYRLSDAKNQSGIAFSLVQLWYYHYPMDKVRGLV
jgi:hypothetical protein